jgi:hypothetical protein
VQRTTVTASILLVLTAMAASCSGTIAHDSPTQPTSVNDQSFASFSAASPSVNAQLATAAGPSCATQPAFTVSIGLIVRANRDIRLFVTTIRMRFTDPFNIQMPQITLPAPQVTQQFGTNLVQARSARTFPLTLPVGCGTQRSGMATIAVDTQDDMGRRESGQISVAVR